MSQVAVGNWTKIVCPQTSRSWRCSIKVSYVTDNLVLRSPRNCAGLHKWSVTQHMLRRSPLKLTDKIRSLKRRENWWKLLVLGIQTGISQTTALCHLFSALPSLSQFGWETLSLFTISFYTLLQLFGSCHLSKFTPAGPLLFESRVI